ncbi:MAG: hypothetical protein KDA60_14510 [Planctomycetales bacterium]|nr:hypothetical protein [Planctomycetales bacterium]
MIARFTFLLVAALVALVASQPAQAVILVLKNGMEVDGKIAQIESVGNDVLTPIASGGDVALKLILVVDDGLRRVFVSTYQKQNLIEDDFQAEAIQLKQAVATQGHRVSRVGAIHGYSSFDPWGRRVCTLQGPKGLVSIIQGVTEITPTWTKLEGLRAQSGNYIWDSRIATSSIPQANLDEFLEHHIRTGDRNGRLSVVRLFIQAEKYEAAEKHLRKAMRDFPDLENLQTQLTELQQLKAKLWVREIRRLQDAGRHREAWNFLANFPDDNVAGELLAEVSQMLRTYDEQWEQSRQMLTQFELFAEQLGDAKQRELADRMLAEFQSELSLNNFNRLADFLRLSSDAQLSAEEKVALAISSWILGPGAGRENLAVAMSLVEVRRLVREYLNTQPHDDTTRTRILSELRSLEGGDPVRVAKLLAHMKPPVITEFVEELRPSPDEDEQPHGDAPSIAPSLVRSAEDDSPSATPIGFAKLTVPGLEEDDTFHYAVQLPPDYDPYRRYPAIVTLNGTGTTPELQIDWWAGAYHSERGQRVGQATRHGYIVIAPEWKSPTQRHYKYTHVEHAAVLYVLLDALQRFSIDTDRVFLSGHSMGGDAAWDIALAHPDLWAGVIPIVATAVYEDKAAPKYVTQYWNTAQHVPWYFVSGSLDGARRDQNAADWNRYLTSPHTDAMVVEFRGRGHEHFSDEIQKIFTWMGLHTRNYAPKKIESVTMRPWDNYFWWLELDDIFPTNLTSPIEWPRRDRGRPGITEAEIRNNNLVIVKAAADTVTVWLTPELVDFDQPVKINTSRRNVKETVEPKLEILLEDARQRRDRQHPFWAKLSTREE